MYVWMNQSNTKYLTYLDRDHPRQIPLAKPQLLDGFLDFSTFSSFSSLFSQAISVFHFSKTDLADQVFTPNIPLTRNRKQQGEDTTLSLLKSRLGPTLIQQPNFQKTYLPHTISKCSNSMALERFVQGISNHIKN